MRLFLSLFVCCAVALAPVPVRAADSLKVIVVDGDEAANIVAERLAAEPVIEVRDKDDRKVPGAVVRFVIRKTRDKLLASFGNGQAEVRTLTDYSGRASVNAVSPMEPGTFQIDVEVSYRGQTGKAVIRQTNFPTSADAKAAGREPGKSTNSNAQTSTAGATTGAAASPAGAATAGTATTAMTAAVSAGGGVSKMAVIGLVTAGAAGAGAAIVLSQRKADPPAGTVGAITASAATGVQSSTVFTFSVQATNFEASSLGYGWEFGDGTTSADPSPTHVYDTAGAFTVVVTVRDARQSARSELPVRVHTWQGTWVNPDLFRGITLELTQSASTIAGLEHVGGQTCPVSGTVRRGAPDIVLTSPGCPQTIFGDLPPHLFRFVLASDGSSLSGQADYGIVQYVLRFDRR
jgi:PKD domain